MHADTTLIDENRDPKAGDILVMTEGTPFWVQKIPRDERSHLGNDEIHCVLNVTSPRASSGYCLHLLTLSPQGAICEFFVSPDRCDAAFVQI